VCATTVAAAPSRPAAPVWPPPPSPPPHSLPGSTNYSNASPRTRESSGYHALPDIASPRQSVPAAVPATAWLRRAGPPAPPLPRLSVGIGSRRPRAALRLCPAGHAHRTAGIPVSPPPPHGRGPHCNTLDLSRVLNVKQGHVCETAGISRDLGRKWISNSITSFADSCKFRRKTEKCKPNFAGFLVKSTTTFVILA
jgi:hypothetical protein